MARVSVMASDLSGKQGEDAEFGRVAIRRYPGLDSPVQLDVLPQEVDDLQAMDDLVEIEYTEPGSDQPRTMLMNRQDFDALAPDMAKVLANARGLRGRRRTGT